VSGTTARTSTAATTCECTNHPGESEQLLRIRECILETVTDPRDIWHAAAIAQSHTTDWHTTNGATDALRCHSAGNGRVQSSHRPTRQRGRECRTCALRGDGARNGRV